MILTAIYVVIQVVSTLALIFLILMHSGKGGNCRHVRRFCRCRRPRLDRRRAQPRPITVTVALIFALNTLTLDLRLQ